MAGSTKLERSLEKHSYCPFSAKRLLQNLFQGKSAHERKPPRLPDITAVATYNNCLTTYDRVDALVRKTQLPYTYSSQ
jgi:hypothetical protein